MRFLFLMSVLSLAFGCAYQPQKTAVETDKAAETAEAAAAAKLDASYVSEVEFSKNATGLDETARESLRRLVEDARKSGRINEVKVAVWADQDYPGKAKRRLNQKDREVASKRANAIEDYLDELEVGDVDIYNMAERPNALERLLNTSDAKVKNALESAGLTGGESVLNSKSSRAVVMVVLED